jgi:hypothetical protein
MPQNGFDTLPDPGAQFMLSAAGSPRAGDPGRPSVEGNGHARLKSTLRPPLHGVLIPPPRGSCFRFHRARPRRPTTMRRGLLRFPGCVFAAVALSMFSARAHTLPVSYLRLAADPDYLHLEFVCNPFELTFLPEVDDNRDAELSPAELSAHGPGIADRVVTAFQIAVAGRPVRAETAGVDPEMDGHHVRVRAHYRVDARHAPLRLESDLISITSASHLTQVTYLNDRRVQRAQLDSRSREVTFAPPSPRAIPGPPTRPAVAIANIWPLLTVLALFGAGAGLLLFARKKIP